MINIVVKTFKEWRDQARRCLLAQVSPEQINWRSDTQQQDLFGEVLAIPLSKPSSILVVSQEFLDLARIVSCHQDPSRWSLLYQAIWRINQGEKHLLSISSDPLIQTLYNYRKAVSRDKHKMKAFIRFQLYKENDEEFFIAWYQPDHNIVHEVAPFFKKRFAIMNWTIMTPYGTVSWNKQQLIFSEGVSQSVSVADEMETLWCTYYKSIFNPARVKLKAMRAEMPVRYWHTMPETKLIPELIKTAASRAAKMFDEQDGFTQSAKDFFPQQKSLSALSLAAKDCRACHLHSCARQTVFGKGPESADIMLIGEQPGLQEDIEGEPFIGPAGQLLQEIANTLDLPLSNMYVTNMVKHFKHEVIRGRQIHRSPTIHEVNACKPWVLEEIKLVNPKVIICLGNTAAKALIRPDFTMKNWRGKWIANPNYVAMGTFHPSSILRQPNVAQQQAQHQALTQDLASAIQLLSINQSSP